MATTIQPPEIDQEKQALRPSDEGGGGFRNLVPVDRDLKAVADHSSEPARTGIWVGLAAITMTFAAFTSALFVRESTATDWHHLSIPLIVYFNTLVLLASSIALEIARRHVAGFARKKEITQQPSVFWLGITLGLGLIFVVGQCLAWFKLRAQGLYLATNPNSSFFYVLTAVHALHVLGGLGGLVRVIHKVRQPVLSLRRSTMDATSYYWHFMGILWLYVLVVMWIQL
jgi:cytochrome c oxidase subunit III